MATIILASKHNPEYWRGQVYSVCAGTMVGKVKGVQGNLDLFAPTWEIVLGHKNGTISDDGYITAYRAMIVARRKQIATWVAQLPVDAEVTLLCHCVEGKFCHRQLMAKMFAKWFPQLNIELH